MVHGDRFPEARALSDLAGFRLAVNDFRSYSGCVGLRAAVAEMLMRDDEGPDFEQLPYFSSSSSESSSESSSTTSSAAPQPIPVGTRGELRGLKAKPRLNGQRGIVKSTPFYGRCIVQLGDDEGDDDDDSSDDGDGDGGGGSAKTKQK